MQSSVMRALLATGAVTLFLPPAKAFAGIAGTHANNHTNFQHADVPHQNLGGGCFYANIPEQFHNDGSLHSDGPTHNDENHSNAPRRTKVPYHVDA